MRYKWVDSNLKGDIIFLKVSAILISLLYLYAVYAVYMEVLLETISIIDAIKSIAFLLTILLILLIAVSSMGESFILPRLEGTYLILPDPHWYNLFSKIVLDINDISEMYTYNFELKRGQYVEGIWKVHLKNGSVINFIKGKKISPAGRLELKEILLRELDGRVKIIPYTEQSESDIKENVGADEI